jgi:hypothetical protein
MEPISIAGTKSTPAVRFINNVFILSGQSSPHNAEHFFQPVIKWVEDYLKIMEGTACFEFNLEYIDQSSSKCIMDILNLLNHAHAYGKDVIINWYYNIDNYNALETAQKFKGNLTVPFNIIPQEG